MKTKLYSNWQKTLLSVALITCFILGNSFSAQAQLPLSIAWNKEVGCQTYELDEKREIALENIGSSDCIRFCEYSSVTYTLSNLPAGAVTTWNAIGGTISSSSSSTCIVNWTTVGAGGLSFTVTSGNSIINKTMCIEKVAMPKAYFEVVPFGQSQSASACRNQLIDFTNLSTTNNGTNLVSYHWRFGDGTSSTVFEPSHTYLNNGTYNVVLTGH